MSTYSFFQVDHLLGGDYPVNASELSILKIILEWLESAQGASGKFIKILLRHILDSDQIIFLTKEVPNLKVSFSENVIA